MLFEPCALSLSVSVSWCKWKAGLDLPMDFIKATVVSSLFLTTPKALPLSLPFPLSCGLGSWDLASPHEPPLPLLSPPLLPDGVVGFLSPLPGVVGVGLVPCVEGECSRHGTRNAPIPAAMRAAAPSVRLLGTIILFSYLPLFSDPFPSGYIIQGIVHARTCQSILTRRRNLSGTVGGYRKPTYCHRIRRNR